MTLSTFGSIFLTSSEFSVATITDARYGVTIGPIKQVPIQTSGDDKVLGKLELKKWIVKVLQLDPFHPSVPWMYTPWKERPFLGNRVPFWAKTWISFDTGNSGSMLK